MVHPGESVQFSPNMVVCLEQGNLRLFGEVVQMVPLRWSSNGWQPTRCWVRPLAMAQVIPEALELALLHDLRESAHLVLPALMFREALDVELIPLMGALFHPEKANAELQESEAARRAMNQLVREVSVAKMGLFRSED